jgi:formamidopyrimidine-DNA glycosylase
MPELPEIETVRKSLKGVKGKIIQKLHLSQVAPVEYNSPQELRRSLTKKTLTNLSRHGKYLRLHTNGDADLVVHLGMSGQLRWRSPSDLQKIKHTHMEIIFQDDSKLCFIDPRRFGTLSLTKTKKGDDNPFLARLGPSYDDKKLTHEEFIQRCRRHPKLSLKNLALSQGVAAGLGNIYACETLYQANLHPQQLVQKTTDQELIQLLTSARHCLALGIHHGGTTFRDYLDGLGHRGQMKKFLQVYDREGEKTLDGRGIVIRIVQNARSTFFCPEVQR